MSDMTDKVVPADQTQFENDKVKELNELKVELVNNDDELNARKESLANAIKSAFGDDIKITLTQAKEEAASQPKPEKKKKPNFFKKLLKVCQ